MKTLTEILQELTAIQDLLGSGDRLIIEPKDIRLERGGPQVSATPGGTVQLVTTIAIGSQAVAAILEERHANREIKEFPK